MAKELEPKYGCNPNQKPARIFMQEGELPIKVLETQSVMTERIKNESQNVEYKETWRDDYLKWICGFANAQGGRIYLGVNDKGEIVGLADSKRLMVDIPNKIITHLGIVADVNLLTSADGKEYMLFGKDPQRFFPSAIFRIGRFGADESDLMFQDTIEGNILQMADRVVTVLRSKYLISPVHYKGMQRLEPLDIPRRSAKDEQRNDTHDPVNAPDGPVNDPVNGPVSSPDDTVNVSEAEMCLIRLLKENPYATYANMGRQLSKSSTTIKRMLKKLREANILVRHGSDKTGYWEIVNVDSILNP